MLRPAVSAGQSFVRFLAVGTVGFIVDASIVTALMLAANWPAVPARVVSMGTAITVTWMLNRRFAFPERRFPRHLEYAGYVGIQLAGAALNLAVFVACLNAWPGLARWPVVPQSAGSVLALFFNFVAARRILYAPRESSR